MLVTGCRWAGIPAPEFATEYIETAVRQVSQQNGELAVGDKEVNVAPELLIEASHSVRLALAGHSPCGLLRADRKN